MIYVRNTAPDELSEIVSETAKRNTFSIRLEGKMLHDLRRDYHSMSGMIFGEAPSFEALVENIGELEVALNLAVEDSVRE